MLKLQFGLSSYKRAAGDLPRLDVVNLYGEPAPTEDGGVALQSRPGLDDRAADMGAGPVRGLFMRDLVVGGSLYGVSGSGIYQATTSLGALGGSGPVSMAGYEDNVFFNAGAEIKVWNGTALTALSFPDGANVAKILVAASRLVAIRKDTGQFYWSEPLDTGVDGAAFATAENQPDRLLDALFIDDVLLLFGAETVEFWPNTGDSNLPFQPLEGRVLEKGIRATGCATGLGSTFAWVTNENQVCVQDENNIISEPGLQARIEASASCALFTFLLDGVEFLALRLDEETQVWSPRTRLWSEFASYGLDNWIVQCSAGGVFGSAEDGKTLAWGTGHQDIAGVLERRFRAGFALDAGGVSISNVAVRANVGQTPFLTGDYAAPQIEMRVSRTAGQTWGPWKTRQLGAQGQYRKKVRWGPQGMASQPGFLAEFRVTAPVPVRASGVTVNEAWGGR